MHAGAGIQLPAQSRPSAGWRSSTPPANRALPKNKLQHTCSIVHTPYQAVQTARMDTDERVKILLLLIHNPKKRKRKKKSKYTSLLPSFPRNHYRWIQHHLTHDQSSTNACPHQCSSCKRSSSVVSPDLVSILILTYIINTLKKIEGINSQRRPPSHPHHSRIHQTQEGPTEDHNAHLPFPSFPSRIPESGDGSRNAHISSSNKCHIKS